MMKTLSLVFHAIHDLLIRKLPQFKKKEGFAFLVHPRNIPDVYRKYPFLKNLKENTVEKILKNFWPITVSKVRGVKKNGIGREVTGWIISCPITAKQMMEDRVLAKKFIIESAKLAEKKGAKIIGLGALTASLTRGGLDISSHVKSSITTGRMFTAKIVTETVFEIIKRVSLDIGEIKISVVGAAGSIGSASAQILVKNGCNVINLVDLSDKKERMDALVKTLTTINKNIKISISERVDSIKDSDIIVAATNKPDALIRSEHLKSGAIVVDDAQPSDVDPKIVMTRKDVLILEGGVAHAPSVDANFNFGLKDRNDIYSCLAEVITLASSEDGGETLMYNLGQITDLDFFMLKELEDLSQKLNIKLGQFQNFEKVYSKEDIDFVRDIIKKRVSV